MLQDQVLIGVSPIHDQQALALLAAYALGVGNPGACAHYG